LNRELEVRVTERTLDLAVTNELLKRREEELKEAVRVRDEFLSIASHELKTPITSMKLQAQMLRRKVNPDSGHAPPPEKVAGFLDSSLRQIERLNRLIEDLLDVVRSQAQKLSFHFEPMNLSDLIQEILTRSALQI